MPSKYSKLLDSLCLTDGGKKMNTGIHERKCHHPDVIELWWGFFSSLYIFPFQFTVLMCYIEENKNGSGLVQSPGAKGYDLGPSPRKFALMFFIQFIHSVKKYSLVKYRGCRCVPGS